MGIRALLSRGDGSDDDVDLAGAEPPRLASDELLWVDAQAADAEELGIIRKALKLSDASAAVLDEIPSKPRAIVHSDTVEIVGIAPTNDPDADPIPLQILVGDGWVITHHEEPIPFLDGHRAAIQDQREVGRLTPVEFLVSLLDWHVDAFFHLAEQLEGEVDELDDAALRSERNLLDRLVAMRRRIARARRVIDVHQPVVAELSRPDFLPERAREGAEALTAVAGRFERARDAVSNAREMLIGTFDVHMTRTAQRTNDTMRILTLASVILLPSVVLAGIMGMNFKVSLFEEPNLFWLVIGLMLAMGTITLVVARWRRWL